MSAYDVETILGLVMIVGSVVGFVFGLAVCIRDEGDR